MAAPETQSSGDLVEPDDAPPVSPTPTGQSTRRSRGARAKITGAAMLLVIAPWAHDGWTALRQGFLALAHPFPTCMTELSILDGARAVAQGSALFPPVRDLPFSIHVYNVLNYLPAGLVGRAANLSIDQLMIATRVVPYVSALGLLLLVVWYVRSLGGGALVAALGVSMVLFHHSSTLPDFFRNRPETPGLFFSTLGFILCLARPKHWTVFAALAFTAAFGFKQTFLSAPAAAVINLVVARQPVARLVSTSLLTVVLFTLCCGLAFGSGYFEHTYLAMADNPHDLVHGLTLFFPVLLERHWGLLVVSVAIAVAAVRREAIVVWLVVCLAWTVAIEGKVGADLNYHSELSFVMILVVVTALARLRERVLALAVLSPLIVGTWLAIARHGAGWNEVCFNRISPTPHCYRETPPFGDRRIYVERYRSRKDALILDPEIGVRSGAPAVNDWFLLDLLFRSGFLDFRRLEDELASRRPSLLVVHRETSNGWTLRLLRTAAAAGYVLSSDDGTVLELRRAPRSSAAN